MGASGSGKTTIISCLVGLLQLDQGDIQVFGKPPGKNRSKIGYMPQESALVEELTISEIIWFYGSIYGLDTREITKKTEFFVDLLELPDENRLIKHCSGGEQKRISFALALVCEPELLILDEPTVAVDQLLRAKIWDYLVEITKKDKVTVLLTTHYIGEAEKATHVGFMRNGVLVAQNSPQKVLEILDVQSLDEAFLNLCKRQNSGTSDCRLIDEANYEDVTNSTSTNPIISTVNKQTQMKMLKALLFKNFLQILRNAQ